ncbi:hypothetical protein ACFPRL_31880 [Pseudoclavibacter helvolus]
MVVDAAFRGAELGVGADGDHRGPAFGAALRLHAPILAPVTDNPRDHAEVAHSSETRPQMRAQDLPATSRPARGAKPPQNRSSRPLEGA